MLLFFLLLLFFVVDFRTFSGYALSKNSVLTIIIHVFQFLTSVYILASPGHSPGLISNVFNITHVRLVLGHGRA